MLSNVHVTYILCELVWQFAAQMRGEVPVQLYSACSKCYNAQIVLSISVTQRDIKNFKNELSVCF